MKRRCLASILAVLMALALTACGGSASPSYGGGAKTEAAAAPSAPAMSDSKVEAPAEMMYTADSSAAGGSAQEQGQKLIRTARLEMETTAFDDATKALADMVERLGGYYENSSTANYRSGARWAESTIRIPAEKLDMFLSSAGELCHVTWQELTQDDVSEVYYDTQGRLKTQQIKLERLQELLSKAEVMEDIITIESAISETEWNIENLSGTLRHYDGKVDYATVYINLQEVYKLSNVEEVPDSFGQRLGSAFERGVENFIDTMEDIAVDLAYGWIWWLLGVVVVVVLVRVVKRKGPKTPKLPKLRRNKKTGDEPQE